MAAPCGGTRASPRNSGRSEPFLLARHHVDRQLVATRGNQAYGTIKEATRALMRLADARAGNPGPLGNPVVARSPSSGPDYCKLVPPSAALPVSWKFKALDVMANSGREPAGTTGSKM